jgi:streptogramin lyase
VKKFALFLSLLALSGSSHAQTVSGVDAVVHPLNKHDTDTLKNIPTFADGPRLVPSGGGIWFLEANADRIAFFKDNVITEWPIRSRAYARPFNSIGANPADFQLDGTDVWFMENGTSGIELQESVIAKLDTVTNVLTEWILPISKPAGFLRDPNGIVWVAMSQGSLLRVDLNTLRVQSSRGSDSLAYSGLVRGADGQFYLSDYGSNRIVRIDPQSLVETSWQLFNPLLARLQITQPTLDAAGDIFVAEDINGGAIGRLNLSTGNYDRIGAGVLIYPTHFLLQGRYIYGVETDPFGGDGRIVLLDTQVAAAQRLATTPKTETLETLPNLNARVRTFTLTPITFDSKDAPPDGAIVASSPKEGISRFTLPKGATLTTSTSYSITVVEGNVVAGVRGGLVDFTLLPPGNDTDLAVPFALNSADSTVRTDLLVYDAKVQTADLTVTFFPSPLPPSPAKGFKMAASSTTSIANGLGAGNLDVKNAGGAVLFTPSAGDRGSYQASTRTYASRPDGGTYGFELPATLVGSGLRSGNAQALFLASRETEISIFGIYSPTGSTGSVLLHGPDGAVRATHAFFLPSNNRQEFDPAWGAFDVPAETGDYLTFDVTSGTLLPYAAYYQDSGDIAAALPVAPASDFVFPRVGARANSDTTAEVSQILFANPDPTNPVDVEVKFFPADFSAPPTVQTVTIPPGALDRSVVFDVPGVGSASPAALGAAVVHASAPVWAGARLAHRTSTGEFAGFAAPVVASGVERFLVSSDARLERDLFLFNSGQTGQVNLRSYDAAGKPAGDFGFSMVSGTSANFADVVSFLNLGGGGRVEVEGAAGTSVSGLLASTEKKTGDIDIQGPLPASP